MITASAAGKLLTIAFLIVCAVLDYKYKKIDLRVFGMMLIAELIGYVLLMIMGEHVDYSSIIAGICVGVFIFIMSKLTGGKIGTGDAFYFALTGAAMGGLKNVCILLGGVLVCAVIGFVMNMKKSSMNRELALLTATLPFGVLAVLAG